MSDDTNRQMTLADYAVNNRMAAMVANTIEELPLERMAMSRVKKHVHCWHPSGHWWNGMATAGEASRKCCHCGQKQVRDMRSSHDPKHGAHVTVERTVFVGRWRTGD